MPDPAAGRIRLGPGARWGHVAEALLPHGLAISSGDYGDVGAGGLATAGGIGFLGREHGLTIDHVTAVGRRVQPELPDPSRTDGRASGTAGSAGQSRGPGPSRLLCRAGKLRASV